MRAFKLHELVNKLPEPKKASLKALFGLLSEVAKEHEVNRVSFLFLSGTQTTNATIITARESALTKSSLHAHTHR